MKKYILATLVGAAMVVLSSCSVTYPGIATSNPIGKKTGVAERTIFFNLAFGTTDVGIEKAAKNGGITKIATVDFCVRSGLFKTTYKTIVTGE